MQGVQLDSFVPQIQTKQNSAQKISGEGGSFLEMVHSQQSKIEETSKEKKLGLRADSDSEKDEKLEKSEKSEKSPSENKNAENAVLTLLKNGQMEEIPAEKIDLTDELKNLSLEDSLESEKTQISQEQLKWLKTPVVKNISETDEIEEMSSEDFAELIDSAIEFIPGQASDEELLEKAQNLVLKDPEMFLKNAENLSETQGETVVLNEELKFFKNNSKLADENEEKLKQTKKSAKIQVTDLRTEKIDSKSAEIQVEKTKERKDFNLAYKKQNENTVQFTMDFSNSVNQNITASDTQSAAANGSTFQNMLSNAIQANAPDFVKAGNIVLRDNNTGSINLVMHPEKLGNVKIALNLSDKTVSASITVHSQEAYNAVKDSIAALKNAFAGSGFETGEFNLNFANQGGQFAQNHEQNSQNGQSQFFANRVYSEYTADGGALADEKVARYVENNSYAVNIVA